MGIIKWSDLFEFSKRLFSLLVYVVNIFACLHVSFNNCEDVQTLGILKMTFLLDIESLIQMELEDNRISLSQAWPLKIKGNMNINKHLRISLLIGRCNIPNIVWLIEFMGNNKMHVNLEFFNLQQFASNFSYNSISWQEIAGTLRGAWREFNHRNFLQMCGCS